MTCVGMATGADRAWAAATQTIESFSTHDSHLSNAHSLLVNITSNSGLKLAEMESVMNVAQCAAEEATIIVGSVFDETMGDELRVTVVATGV